MRYVQLRAFHYVAICGGFSRAAEELYLTQPAISDQVRKLEEEYDILLFNRQRKQVVFEFRSPPRSGDAYLRFIPRTEMDIAVVGAGVSLTLDKNGVCTAARVALGAVAPTVVLVPAAAKALIGTKLDDEALQKAAAAASAACRPIDDKRGTKEYRIKVAGVMTRRAAQIALERARGN